VVGVPAVEPKPAESAIREVEVDFLAQAGIRMIGYRSIKCGPDVYRRPPSRGWRDIKRCE
jgi:hypothetical protein